MSDDDNKIVIPIEITGVDSVNEQVSSIGDTGEKTFEKISDASDAMADHVQSSLSKINPQAIADASPEPSQPLVQLSLPLHPPPAPGRTDDRGSHARQISGLWPKCDDPIVLPQKICNGLIDLRALQVKTLSGGFDCRFAEFFELNIDRWHSFPLRLPSSHLSRHESANEWKSDRHYRWEFQPNDGGVVQAMTRLRLRRLASAPIPANPISSIAQVEGGAAS
jgi:hypothetical protein